MKRRAIDSAPPSPHNESAPDQLFAAADPFSLRQDLLRPRRRSATANGRRDHAIALGAGHPAGALVPRGPLCDIALFATLRAAAMRHIRSMQTNSEHAAHASIKIQVDDVRVKQRKVASGNLIIFVVDASASMGARKRMVAVKGAVLSFFLDTYQKRDWIGLIAFRNHCAQLLVSPTNSVDLAERRLRQMPTGGRTPLAAGIQLAAQTLASYQRRQAALAPRLVLITDGRANEGPSSYIALHQLQVQGIPILIVDSEAGYVRLGAARKLATALQAAYVPLEELATRR